MPTSKILGYIQTYTKRALSAWPTSYVWLEISHGFPCLNPSPYQPIFIPGTFPRILKLFWSCSGNFLPTTPGQPPHKAFWSLASWYFCLSQMLYMSLSLHEGVGVMKHPEPQNNLSGFAQPDISSLTAKFLIIWKTDQGICSCIPLLRILQVKNNTQPVVQQLESTARMQAVDGTCRWFWSKGSGRKEWETGQERKVQHLETLRLHQMQ